MRSLDKHLEQCERLEENPGGDLSKEYGINYRSPLAQLKYFDICSGALVTDVMHDLLEGMLQDETKNMLRHLNSMKVLKAKELTNIMESFEFGYMEIANRPTPISRKTLKSKDNSLKQNGKLFIKLNLYKYEH